MAGRLAVLRVTAARHGYSTANEDLEGLNSYGIAKIHKESAKSVQARKAEI